MCSQNLRTSARRAQKFCRIPANGVFRIRRPTSAECRRAALWEFPHADHSARQKAPRPQKKNTDGIHTILTGASPPCEPQAAFFVFAEPPDVRAPRSKILPHNRKRRFSYPPPHIAGRPHAALREFPHADHSARQKAPRPQKKNTDGIRMTLTGAARPSGGARPARGPQPE